MYLFPSPVQYPNCITIAIKHKNEQKPVCSAFPAKRGTSDFLYTDDPFFFFVSIIWHLSKDIGVYLLKDFFIPVTLGQEMKVRGSLAQEGTDSKGDTGIERCRQEQKEVHSKRKQKCCFSFSCVSPSDLQRLHFQYTWKRTVDLPLVNNPLYVMIVVFNWDVAQNSNVQEPGEYWFSLVCSLYAAET
ncbi:hypothetical protein AB205_0096570 [Aquarana catesbeiana]|uniref:Uncharacterized protein n=1 Tax=Aquarana catesbeiana TaxID=8400 RepID=A0A2G9SA64_AQUCT|nr:hypothetical protein AB205_0096570 [Aquarana catesbeiana]